MNITSQFLKPWFLASLVLEVSRWPPVYRWRTSIIADGQRTGFAFLFPLLLVGILIYYQTAAPPGAEVWFPMLPDLFLLGLSHLWVGLAAVLVYLAVGVPGKEGHPASHVDRMVLLFLAVIVLVFIAYSVYIESIWAQTRDGPSSLLLFLPSVISAAVAGILLVIVFKGWLRLGGVAFGFLVALLIFLAANMGGQAPYKQATENRAGRIEAALERYYGDHGTYPEVLRELAPRYMLVIPEPLILRDVGWCYRGEENYYQLGTFYREFFGLPVSFRIYAQAGDPADSWMCEEKMEYVHTRHPIYGSFDW